MVSMVLFVLAAVAFGVLAGVIEYRWARQARRRLLHAPSPVLHPLQQHRLARLRPVTGRRALCHVVLFLGFLVVSYLGVTLVQALYSLLAKWLS